jgi:hypothetical protein
LVSELIEGGVGPDEAALSPSSPAFTSYSWYAMSAGGALMILSIVVALVVGLHEAPGAVGGAVHDQVVAGWLIGIIGVGLAVLICVSGYLAWLAERIWRRMR